MVASTTAMQMGSSTPMIRAPGSMMQSTLMQMAQPMVVIHSLMLILMASKMPTTPALALTMQSTSIKTAHPMDAMN